MARPKLKTAGRRKASAKCLYCGKKHASGFFWNKGKGCWSLVVGRGRSRMLAKGFDAHDEALRRFHSGDLPEGKGDGEKPNPLTGSGEQTLAKAIIEAFLQNKEFKPKFADYKRDLGALAKEIGGLTVADLRIDGVRRIKAFAARQNWCDGTQAIFFSRVKAAFNYATDKDEDSLGWIESNPIRKLNTGSTRKEASIREAFFSREQIQTLLSEAAKSTRCPSFATALKMLLAMPCRPGEFCSVTSADCKKDEKGHLFWEVSHKNITKTKKRRRVYHVHPSMDKKAQPLFSQAEIEEITRAACNATSDGPIFRNGYGEPWENYSLVENFRRLCRKPACRKLGLDEVLNHREIEAAETAGKPKPRKRYKYVLYTCRHTYSVEAVKVGWPFERTASLQGNSPKMQATVYAKIDKSDGDFISALQ